MNEIEFREYDTEDGHSFINLFEVWVMHDLNIIGNTHEKQLTTPLTKPIL